MSIQQLQEAIHTANRRKASDLVSREDAAAYLGVSPKTLATWATTRRYLLPYVKVGRVVRYRLADLDRFIESRTVTPGEVQS